MHTGELDSRMKHIREHHRTQTDTVRVHDRRWIFRAGLLMAFDAATIALSYLFALYMRFDFVFSAIDPSYLTGYRTLVDRKSTRLNSSH